MKIYLYSLGLLATIAFSSCATIFNGSKQNVTFTSNIKEPVTLTVDKNTYTDVTFPFDVKVKRGFSPSPVRAEAKGYQTSTLYIDKEFNPVTILSIFFGGLIGVGIDAGTGAMMKTEYNEYNIPFRPEESVDKKDIKTEAQPKTEVKNI